MTETPIKELSFSVGNNFYHTLKERNLTTGDGCITGMAFITGYTKEELTPLDVLLIQGVKYHVMEVLERRNHSGEFVNPDDAINGYFKVDCSFKKLVPTK